MSLLDRLPATEARPYGPCPLSARCVDDDSPPAPDACGYCPRHDHGMPYAADVRDAAREITHMTDEQRARLDAAARRDHARMTGGTRP